MDHILVDDPAPGVRRITLNRPEKLNAFTFDMYVALREALEALRYDVETRVVILTGAGSGFCSGHDMTEAVGSPNWVAPGSGPAQFTKTMLTELGRIPVLMRSLPQPVICAVNGTCGGIGYALALAGDLCLAAKSAKFINLIHNAATGCELGLSWMLPRAVGAQRAAEILLTARPVLADEAERIGLVLRAVADAALMADALALAEQIKVNVPIGIWLTKQSLWINQGVGSLEQAIELEHRAVYISQSTQDAAEKRAAVAERRAPVFRNL
jgi:enoyl-CoA hydratase